MNKKYRKVVTRIANILTVGEPMVMFVADKVGSLDEINHFTKYLAGSEVNVCIGLVRLGHRVSYLTKLGDDPFGTYIKNYLLKEDIQTDQVTIDDRYPTGFQLKSKVAEGDPEVVYFRKGSAASHLNPTDVSEIRMAQFDHLHLTGIPPALSLECRETIQLLLSEAKALGIPITFDPNLRPNLWSTQEEMVETINTLAFQCDIVLPGVEEGLILTGSSDPEHICDYYLKQGVKQVIVKLGPEGAFVKSADGSLVVPGFKVDKVVDTVGAGDGFAVGFIDGYIAGKGTEQSVCQANAIGAIQVTTQGDNDGLPDRVKLEKWLETKS